MSMPGEAEAGGARAEAPPVVGDATVDRNALPWVVVWWAASALLAGGWALFDYLCDDAYIAFRYVHNLLEGRGLVWNPAPFQPVEGYSSLLWVLVLAAAWKITGLDPTVTATPVLLVCSVGSLGLLAWMVRRAPLRHLGTHRAVLGGLALLGTATNLTFVQWSTSGLEQALHTLLVLAWCAVALFRRPSATAGLVLAGLAALLELARPDGLLFLAATVAWVAAAAADRRPPADRLACYALCLAPLAIPIAHLLWRRATYGAWLPNTYFAKHAGAWPDMGAVYFAGFVLEYALFLWLPPAVAALRTAHRPPRFTREGAAKAVAPLAIVAHFLYYTLSVGGDHFGFRVYHHLVPLLWLGLVLLVDRAGWRPRVAVAWVAFAVLAAAFVPWTHWAVTRNPQALEARGLSPHDLHPHVPRPLAPWAALWDLQQRHTRAHFVGVRHRAHRHNIDRLKRSYPSRAEGSLVPWDPEDVPVHVAAAVGYPGWALPNVAILDALGLNDAVIARQPLDPGRKRKMGHDRRPPPGYRACFRPNVVVSDGSAQVRARRRPLTVAEVASCEARYWTHGPLPRQEPGG